MTGFSRLKPCPPRGLPLERDLAFDPVILLHVLHGDTYARSALPVGLVLFIDASQQYEQGKNQNVLRDADIDKIVETYRKFNAGKLRPGVVEDKYAYVATFDEIRENDFNLNIPRYVDTFEEEAEVNITGVQQEIERLEGELKTVQAELDKYLKELIN